MKPVLRKSVLSLAVAASLLGSTTWSTVSHACAETPYMASICVMAMPNYTTGFGNNTYVLAAGQMININQNQALFALISNTYGGDARNNFQLPDMRGRVVVGAGQGAGLPLYNAGQKGGATAVQLTASQLPTHVHTLNANTSIQQPNAKATVAGSFTATTTLNATANLAGIPFTSSTSNLSMKALSTVGNSPAPSTGSYLAKSPLGGAMIYTTSTPDTTMAPGSVVGTVSGNLSGTAPVIGNANTTISGLPTVAISGSTDVAGSSAAVPIMPPYLSMYYYIAQTGIFPQRD